LLIKAAFCCVVSVLSWCPTHCSLQKTPETEAEKLMQFGWFVWKGILPFQNHQLFQ